MEDKYSIDMFTYSHSCCCCSGAATNQWVTRFRRGRGPSTSSTALDTCKGTYSMLLEYLVEATVGSRVLFLLHLHLLPVLSSEVVFSDILPDSGHFSLCSNHCTHYYVSHRHLSIISTVAVCLDVLQAPCSMILHFCVHNVY